MSAPRLVLAAVPLLGLIASPAMAQKPSPLSGPQGCTLAMELACDPGCIGHRSNRWWVITEGAAELAEARKLKAALAGTDATLANSNCHEGLNPGLYVVLVGLHETRAQATAQVAALGKQGIKAYARQALGEVEPEQVGTIAARQAEAASSRCRSVNLGASPVRPELKLRLDRDEHDLYLDGPAAPFQVPMDRSQEEFLGTDGAVWSAESTRFAYVTSDFRYGESPVTLHVFDAVTRTQVLEHQVGAFRDDQRLYSVENLCWAGNALLFRVKVSGDCGTGHPGIDSELDRSDCGKVFDRKWYRVVLPAADDGG